MDSPLHQTPAEQSHELIIIFRPSFDITQILELVTLPATKSNMEYIEGGHKVQSEYLYHFQHIFCKVGRLIPYYKYKLVIKDLVSNCIFF